MDWRSLLHPGARSQLSSAANCTPSKYRLTSEAADERSNRRRSVTSRSAQSCKRGRGPVSAWSEFATAMASPPAWSSAGGSSSSDRSKGATAGDSRDCRRRGGTKTGRLWVYAASNEHGAGREPPAAVYLFAPDRSKRRCVGSAHFTQSKRKSAANSPPFRLAVRQQRSKQIVDDLRLWLGTQLSLVLERSTIADAIHYAMPLCDPSLASAYTLPRRWPRGPRHQPRRTCDPPGRSRKEESSPRGQRWRRQLMGWSLFVD